VHPVDFGAESAKGVVAMLEQALADVKRSEPLRLSKDGHTIVHVKDEEKGESDG